MPNKEWRPFRYFNVEVLRVIDGDTIEANVDLGYHVTFKTRFRLLGVNTPERRKEIMEEYKAATAFTQKWCDDHAGRIEIETMEKDSFGRWLALFRCQVDGEYLNQLLIDEGHSPDDYRGGLKPYLRSPIMLAENLSEASIKEAIRLEEIGYIANRTKGTS
jgi:micrococcal nuclease